MISLQVAEPTSPVIFLEDPREIGQGSSDVRSWGYLPLIQQKRIHWCDRERNRRRTGDKSPERAGTGPLGGWWRRAGGSPPGGLAQHPFGRGGRGTEPRSRHVRSARPALCRAGGWGGGGGDIPPGHCPVGRGGVPVQNWGAVSKRRAHATCHAISHNVVGVVPGWDAEQVSLVSSPCVRRPIPLTLGAESEAVCGGVVPDFI